MPFDGTDFSQRRHNDRPARPVISSKQVAVAVIGLCASVAVSLVGWEYALSANGLALAVLYSAPYWMPLYTKATGRPEILWAVAIATAAAFPVLWSFVALAALLKLTSRATFYYSLWHQGKRGPRLIEIDGQRFECWLHRNGSTSAVRV